VEITVSDLAAFVGGQLLSGADGSKLIRGAASLSEAGEGDVTFFGNPKYLPQLRASQATAALVPSDFEEKVGALCIRCENPTQAFAKILERFAPPPVTHAPGVHPTAIIGRDVLIGEGASIQPYVVLEDGARIGANTVIGAHGYVGHGARVGNDTLLHARVTVGARCIVGDRVILHSGVVLGSDGFGFEFQNGRHVKIPQTGIVQIDDDVEIGANTCLDRARFGRTWVKAGTKIDNLVQIGHNVIIGPHCIICGQVGLSGSVKLGAYVTLAGQVGAAGHLEVADQVMVGGKGGINKSLPNKGIYMGNPAVDARQYREQVAHIHGLGKLKARVRALEQLLREAGKSLPPET
jgi:UDP-3-O-[3-hydroxymyristoyl] glucosamine N-acyltransferase